MSKRDKVVRASINERTSKRVAAIAGKVLANIDKWNDHVKVQIVRDWRYQESEDVCTVGELQALAASALTQTRNKGPIEVTARRKKVRATARPKKAGRVGRK